MEYNLSPIMNLCNLEIKVNLINIYQSQKFHAKCLRNSHLFSKDGGDEMIKIKFLWKHY